MARALQVFFDSDLRCSHDGLALVAKKAKIDVSKLQPGEYVLFINSEKNKLKLFTANNVLAYLRLERGKLEERTISLIPEAFMASGKIDYEKALRQVIEKELGKK